jgi:hypothetical protein
MLARLAKEILKGGVPVLAVADEGMAVRIGEIEVGACGLGQP